MHFFNPAPNIDFRACSLTEGKEWFISFYVTNPSTEKLKRIRIKVNRIHGIRDRRKAAREMMAAIDQRLALGWNPLVESVAPKSFEKIGTALDMFLKIKRKETEQNTMRSYESFVKTFREWMKENGISEDAYSGSISKEVARSFMNDKEPGLSAKTYNNYLNFYTGMFNWLVDKRYCDVNPFSDLDKKPKRLLSKQRRLLKDDELSKLMNYLQKANPQYLAMAMLCYGCFIRPKELSLLKCSDIDLTRQVVHIRAEVAKNDNDSFRTIPDDMMPVLRKLDLSHGDWFLFGQNPGYEDFRPSKTQACSRKYARYWNMFVRPACGFGQEIQFYSLKDTGITNMLTDGVPINLVQQQADHSSVAMTAIYVGKKADASSRLKKADLLK